MLEKCRKSMKTIDILYKPGNVFNLFESATEKGKVKCIGQQQAVNVKIIK